MCSFSDVRLLPQTAVCSLYFLENSVAASHNNVQLFIHHLAKTDVSYYLVHTLSGRQLKTPEVEQIPVVCSFFAKWKQAK